MSLTPAKPDVSIDELERLIYARQYEAAGRLLVTLLHAMADHGSNKGFYKADERRSLSAVEETRIATRIAGAITALLADPGFRLSQSGYEVLVSACAHAGALFELSGYGTSEHIWPLVASLSPSGDYNFTEDALRKAYATATLTSTPTALIQQLRDIPREIAVPALIGLLSSHLVLSDAAEESRNVALGLGPLFDGYPLTSHNAAMLVGPWMLCSYADIPGKHAIKAHMNEALRAWMQRQGVDLRSQPPRVAGRAKPVMAIMLEWGYSYHAMMRCYSKLIASLRDRFELVAFVTVNAIDDAARGLFDAVYEMGKGDASLRPNLDAVMKVAPDAIFYPSVGMAGWAICFANLRLAPLQFMMMGHPATSHSKEMDFVVVSNGVKFNPDRFSEKVLMVPSAISPFDLHFQTIQSPPKVRENPDVLRIAVPAKLFKLSSRFLKACRRIAELSRRPIEFRFFPNERGATHHRARQWIESTMGDRVPVTVYPTTNYATYLHRLDECDIALGAFAFGNTNGAVDSILRCVPCVALDGPELHHGSEQAVMRPCGLPEWLIAEDEDAYVEAVLRLIHQDEERVAISRSLEGKVDAWLAEENSKVSDFSTAVWWMYENRIELLARPEQVIDVPLGVLNG